MTITAGSSAGAAGNHLRELRIGDAANALIDVAGRTGQTGNVTIALADRPTQLTMTVRRLRTGQGVMVPLVVVDDCGEWPTFVGSGGSGPPDRPGSTSR